MLLIHPQFYRVVPLSSQFGKAHFWPLIYHLSAVTDDVDSAAEYSALALCFSSDFILFAAKSSISFRADRSTPTLRFSSFCLRPLAFTAFYLGSNNVRTAPVIKPNFPESCFLRSCLRKCREQIRGSTRLWN